MSQKRSAGLSLKDVVKKGKTNSSVAVRQNRGPQNPFLSKPIQPEEVSHALQCIRKRFVDQKIN